jgi:hypothetical protein
MSGEKLVLTESQGNFVNLGWNDRVTSIRVTGGDTKNYTLNIRNSFFSFVVGVIEGAAGNETGFYQCLPDSWRKETGEDPGKVGAVDSAFQGWSGSLKTFLNFSGALISAVCYIRGAIISILTFISNQLFGSRRRRMILLESEKSKTQTKAKKAKARRTGLMRVAKYTGKTVAQVQTDMKWVPDWVSNIFGSIRDKINEWYTKITDFFKSETWQNFMKLVNCVLSAKTAGETLKSVFEGIKSKYETISRAVKLTGMVLLVVLVDMLVGLICNWELFKTSINYFIAAWNRPNTDKPMKWFYYGKALGTFVNAVATASTVSEVINEAFNKVTEPAPKRRRRIK